MEREEFLALAARLRPREREVAELLSAGLSNRQAAVRLARRHGQHLDGDGEGHRRATPCQDAGRQQGWRRRAMGTTHGRLGRGRTTPAR